MSDRRVGVVAASAVSPLGIERAGLGDALVAGVRTARLSERLGRTHPGVEGCEVPVLADAIDVGDPKQLRLCSRSARLAAAATRLALRDASWNGPRDDVGYWLGIGGALGAIEDLERVVAVSLDAGAVSMRLLGEKGLVAANPLSTFHLMNNFTLAHSAMLEGVRGPNAAFFSRGAGAFAALVEAKHALASGDCDRALAGAADCALHPVVWATLARDGWAERGLVPAEGAATLALEASPEAPPLAWLDGAELFDATRSLDDVLFGLACDDADALVIAPCDRGTRASLRAFHELSAKSAIVVDVTESLGCALAATSALAWAAAVDLIARGRARRVLVLVVGVDGQLGVARFSAPASPVRARRTVASREAAVVTGVGVVSGFGVGADVFFDGLAAGKGSVGPIRSFDASSFPVRVAGEVPVVRIDGAWMASHLPAPSHGLLERWQGEGVLRDRKAAFAILAAAEAWRSAGCSEKERDATLCLALGLEQGWLEDFAQLYEGRRFDWTREPTLRLPRVRLRSPVDVAARAVHELLALRGPTIVNASACAAGALAVAHAASLVERGEADVVVCGGSDSMVSPLSVGGFASLGATTPRNTSDACRPFDVRRDGLVIGEGAAVFVVESEERARARGMRPLARITGWGSTQDAYRPTAPLPDGSAAARAMRAALSRARLAPEQLGWVNAHGTGTPLNDPAETRALRAALGRAADDVPVSSIKGAVGHLMAASGAIELASCLLAFERGLLCGTANHVERDPVCDVDVIGETPRTAQIDAVLSSSFGFGGQNACVVLRRP